MASNLRLDVEARGDAADLAVMAGEVRTLKQQLDALDGRRVKVKVELDAPSAARIQQARTDIDSLDGRTVKAKLELNLPSPAQAARVDRLKQALDEFDGRVARATVAITGTPSTAEVSALRRAAKALRELDGINAAATVNVTGNIPDPKELRAAARALKALQDASPVNIVIHVSGVASEIAALIALGRAIRSLPSNTTATVNVDVDKSVLGRLSTFTKYLTGLSAAGGVAAAGLINATAAAASLGGSLASLAGLAPLAVGAVAAIGAVGATVAVSMAHISDALGPQDTAAHIKKVNEAMAALSPSAREAVTSVRGFGPAWTSMRLDVQEKAFAGLGTVVKDLGGKYLPILQSGMGGISTQLNLGVKDVAAFVGKASTMRDVTTIFENTRGAVEAARPGVVNLAAAFTDVAVVGTSMLPELASGWTNATGRFREFIANARESGQLKEWIQGGLDTLRQLGSVAGNVGSVLHSVFTAARDSGADFLTTLDRATEGVATFLKSTEGQSALVAMFTEARATIDALLPGLASLGRLALDAVQAFSNTGGLSAFAATVTQVAQSLEPLGAVIGRVAGDALGGLASGAGLAGAALSPIVGIVGGVIGALGPLPGLILASVVAYRALGAASGLFAAGAAKAAAASAYLRASTMPIPGVANASATAMSKVSTVLSRMGSALPIVGVALIGFGAILQASSADFEGLTSKVAAGTLSIEGSMQQALAQTRNWADVLRTSGDIETRNREAIDGMRQSLDEYRAGLGPMQQLQFDVTTSQSALNDAVARYGANSPQAAAAARDLAAATAKAEAAHRGAAEQAKSQADREKELADTMRSQISTAIAYAQAVERTAQAQKTADDAIKQNGKDSQEAKAAVLDLASAMAQQADAAQKQAESWGGNEAGLRAFNTELLKTATASPASRAAFSQLATSLDQAGLDALSAQAKMSGLRTEIMTLPDGRKVTVVVAADAGKLPDVRKQLEDVEARKYVGTIEIRATSENARGDIQQAVTFANGQTGTIKIFADGAPAIVTIGQTKYTVDSTTGVMTIQGNPAPGEANLSGFKLKTDTTTGVTTIEANTAPANAALTSQVTLANGSIGTMTLNANPNPATGQITGTVAYGNGQKATITIDGNQVPSNGKINATVDYGNGKTAIIKVDANAAAANSAIDNAARPRYATINVNTVYTSSDVRAAHGGAIGGIVHAMRDGGALTATGYATGGVRVRPMRGGIAQRVAPGDLRVIGDRVRDDEFYLPDNADPRSMKIGAEWARRRGMALVPVSAASAGRTADAIGRQVPVGREPAGGWIGSAARVQAALQPRAGGATTVLPPDLGPLLAELRAINGGLGGVASAADSGPVAAEVRRAVAIVVAALQPSVAASAQARRADSELARI